MIETKIPALVFIHGFPFSSSMWGGQINFLSNKYNCIAYNIRGFGNNKTEHYYFSLDLFADDLFAMLQARGIEKAILCGLSMGGYIALRFVEKYPGITAGLILCNTKSEADSDAAKTGRFASVKNILENGLENFAEIFIKNIFTEESISNNMAAVDSIRQTILSTEKNSIIHTLIALAARTDTTSVLPKIDFPTLIITGDRDKIAPPDIAESMHRAIPNSELCIMKNTAHMSNLEQPDLFNKTIENFIHKNF